MTEQPTNHIDHIKAWLKSHGRDRFWLADQLNVNKRTADNWLSAGQAIPAAKLALITRLMADDEAAEARRKQQYDPVAQVFSLETDLATFRAYSQAAKHHQLTLEEWCISELNTAADQWFIAGKPRPKNTSATAHHDLTQQITRQAQAQAHDSSLNEAAAPFTEFERALILKAQAEAEAQASAQATASDNPTHSPHSDTPDRTESSALRSEKHAPHPSSSQAGQR